MVFDTYKTCVELDQFIKCNIPDGYIVVAACQDECSSRLSDFAKSWFQSMGSMEIYNVGYREGFVFIGTNGRRTAMEKRAFDPTDTVMITKAFQKTNDFDPIKIVKISDLPKEKNPDL